MQTSVDFAEEVLTSMQRHKGAVSMPTLPRQEFNFKENIGLVVQRRHVLYTEALFIKTFGVSPAALKLTVDHFHDDRGRPIAGVLLTDDDKPLDVYTYHDSIGGLRHLLQQPSDILRKNQVPGSVARAWELIVASKSRLKHSILPQKEQSGERVSFCLHTLCKQILLIVMPVYVGKEWWPVPSAGGRLPGCLHE